MTLLLATSPSQKVVGWFGGYGLKGTLGYPTANGLSLPIAYAVCFFEFFAGVGLMFGLLTRPSALAVIIVMVGAISDGIHDHHSSRSAGGRRPGAAGDVRRGRRVVGSCGRGKGL